MSINHKTPLLPLPLPPQDPVGLISSATIPKTPPTDNIRTTDEPLHPELAVEHALCSQCQNAVLASAVLKNYRPPRGSEGFCRYIDRKGLESSASPLAESTSTAAACHLCSLILGKIQQHDRVAATTTTGSIYVTLQVSRSGGVTLLIQAEETVVCSQMRRMTCELAIVPADDDDVGSFLFRSSVGGDGGAKFTFPGQNSCIYRNAQLAKSLASESSFGLAQGWLRQCLQTHPKCTEAAQTAIGRPSRLIYVGDPDGGMEPRVVLMDYLKKPRQQQHPEYLTLSHCWGGAKILRLLVENLHRLTAGISMSSLPETFRDAIIITRRLGYRYLWIDSLCIIQDSPPDWRVCAAAMGEIYAGSVCTIAALTARNSHGGGCFADHARNPLFFRPCRIHADECQWWVAGNSNVGPDLRTGLSPLPLHTRAWVIQERILAPRALYYGTNGLAWECVECSAAEAVPAGEASSFSPKASFFAVSRPHHGPSRYHEYWTDIQIAYTRCDLTRFDDRLVAISGVVKRLEMLTGWENVWGLWKQRLLLDLLWFVDEPTRARPNTEEYLAPTWSWAGVEGRVMMPLADGGETGCQWTAEVIEVGLLGGGSGDGKRGCVRLRAMARTVKCTADGKLNPGIETPAPIWEEVGWDPDVKLTTVAAVGNEMRCVLIARTPDYLGPGTAAFDIGLVVAQTTAGEWVRAGIFRQLREGNALFPKNVADFTELTIV